jgi:hypothetical protein
MLLDLPAELSRARTTGDDSGLRARANQREADGEIEVGSAAYTDYMKILSTVIMLRAARGALDCVSELVERLETMAYQLMKKEELGLKELVALGYYAHAKVFLCIDGPSRLRWSMKARGYLESARVLDESDPEACLALVRQELNTARTAGRNDSRAKDYLRRIENVAAYREEIDLLMNRKKLALD